MKIAIIRRKFNPFGGAEKFILRAIQGLSQQNIEITVIAESWEMPSSKVDSAKSNTIQRLEAKVSGWSRASKFLSFNRAVARIIQSNTFDLVQSHERLLGADIYRLGDGIHASWVARLTKASPWYMRYWLRIDSYHRAVIRTEREMAKDPKLTYVANSLLVKQELMAWYQVPETRIELIENGIDTSSFSPANQEQKLAQRQALGLNPHFTTVVFVGSGFMRKGAFELVRAIAKLPDFQLIVVGKDKKIKALKKLSATLGLHDRVQITGPQLDVKPYLAAADIFCLPSLYDSFPNAILEALCCGLPIVTTDAVGIREAITAQRAGVVCQRDVDNIAQALRHTLEHLDTMSSNALKLSKQYDIQIANERWNALYKRLIIIKTLHPENSP